MKTIYQKIIENINLVKISINNISCYTYMLQDLIYRTAIFHFNRNFNFEFLFLMFDSFH